MARAQFKFAWKLLRKRKDGSLGPLFINCRQRIQKGVWLPAEDHPTKGFKHRPGWHCTARPVAPHLSQKGRVWCRVRMSGYREQIRPAAQGGKWYIADEISLTKREYIEADGELVEIMIKTGKEIPRWKRRPAIWGLLHKAKPPFVS